LITREPLAAASPRPPVRAPCPSSSYLNSYKRVLRWDPSKPPMGPGPGGVVGRTETPVDVVVDRADVLHERVHARALLAEPTHAGAQFEKALAKPAGEQWPFERAQLRLDYGDAVARLTALQREIVILAGRGLTNAESPDMPGRLRRALEASPAGRSSVKIVSDRSMQQSDVTLAAHRLANGEIADRLFLSPAPSPHTFTAPIPSSASAAGTKSAT